jgi:hypothetical protein
MKRVLALAVVIALAGCGERHRPPQFPLLGPSLGVETSAHPLEYGER